MQPDDLYGLALDRFVPERTALARALRADKQRDEAAAVAALRKPSVAAWAVNQLVRSQGAAVKDLFDAGDALRGAQADLLAGRGDGRTLRAANERERAAVDELVDAARGLLTSEGHELSPTVVERVDDTLHAAALDEDAREQVRDGRLTRELRHAGLGLGVGVGDAAVAAPQATKPSTPREQRDEGTAKAGRADPDRKARPTREQAAEAKRAARERADARKAARTAEAAARRRAERSGHALRAAEERRARAAQALDEADEAVAAARAEAQDAADAHARAQADIEKL